MLQRLLSRSNATGARSILAIRSSHPITVLKLGSAIRPVAVKREVSNATTRCSESATCHHHRQSTMRKRSTTPCSNPVSKHWQQQSTTKRRFSNQTFLTKTGARGCRFPGQTLTNARHCAAKQTTVRLFMCVDATIRRPTSMQTSGSPSGLVHSPSKSSTIMERRYGHMHVHIRRAQQLLPRMPTWMR